MEIMEKQKPLSASEEMELIEGKERDGLRVIKQLIQGEETLKDLPLEDDLLLLVLRSRRCIPELALKVIKTILEYKEKTYPELFEKVRPRMVKHVLDKPFVQVVKRNKDNSGPAVMVYRTQEWDTSAESMDDLIMAGMLYCYEVAMNSVEVQRKGIVLLIDVGGFGFSQARQCTYSSVMKMANCVIFGSPVRIQGCSLLHSPYIFEKVYQVVKYAIPERYRSYVRVTKNDLSHLHEIVPRSELPESLGGKVPENEGWEIGLEKSILETEQVHKFLLQITKDIKSGSSSTLRI